MSKLRKKLKLEKEYENLYIFIINSTAYIGFCLSSDVYRNGLSGLMKNVYRY